MHLSVLEQVDLQTCSTCKFLNLKSREARGLLSRTLRIQNKARPQIVLEFHMERSFLRPLSL